MSHVSKKIFFVFIIALCLVILLATLLYPRYTQYRQTSVIKEQDYEQIASSEYDAVFFANYPIENFQESDFATYRGIETLKLQSTVTSAKEIQNFIDKILSVKSDLTLIFLGISPNTMNARDLLNITNRYPEISFEILLDCPSLQSWQQLSSRQYQARLERYLTFTSTMTASSNCIIYDNTATHWLVANPGSYSEPNVINPEVAHTLLLDSFCSRNHLITADNCAEYQKILTDLTADAIANPVTYPDLSDKTIVFFGDSVIGNYDGSASIPGVVKGLTGAHTYNLAIGGTCASDTNDDRVSLTQAVNAFLTQDASLMPAGHQSGEYLEQYINDAPDSSTINFVINYGLNDYFEGRPIANNDLMDTSTYTGAVRTAIASLRKAYPQATILLNCPTFSSYFENGTLTNSEEGGTLIDYVAAICTLGEEQNVLVLNNYEALGINAENQGTYLEDGAHPTAETRFHMGQLIIEKIQ